VKRKNDKKYCVYKFVSFDDKVLYIGRTSNFKTRMEMHDNLPKECYNEINKVEVLRFDNIEDMNQAEGYFIKLYKPIYNMKSEIFNKTYETAIWENCIFDFLISSRGRNNNNISAIVDILFFDNVPEEIKNKFSAIKNNITRNNLQALIWFLNSNYTFDKYTMISVCGVLFHNKYSEFNSNPHIGFINNKIKFYCDKDSYIPENIEYFYRINLKEVYNTLIILCNYHFNRNIFDNVHGNLKEVIFIPRIRNGVLFTDREELYEVVCKEIKDRLKHVENIKLRNPIYYK
jgi:predicted GIY-YIG superfamily endonuclease